MKKLLVILAIGLTSCWKTLPDGRQYKISCTCVSGHNSVISTVQVVPGPNGTTTVVPGTQTVWVCDYETCDTIWKNKQK